MSKIFEIEHTSGDLSEFCTSKASSKRVVIKWTTRDENWKYIHREWDNMSGEPQPDDLPINYVGHNAPWYKCLLWKIRHWK